jgi:hypothetical protein
MKIQTKFQKQGINKRTLILEELKKPILEGKYEEILRLTEQQAL